jgi:CubicO group peptidase (beta-lactamase class C family)
MGSRIVSRIPNTPQTRFHLGSLTKQFTAMGILILESQGKLSVQDPICNFFADCPKEWQNITIHHLLTHTSGLSSQWSQLLYSRIDSATSGPVAPAEQAQYLGLTTHWYLDSQLGERYDYNNFGYILLARIIEQVSGQSYSDYLNQTIFTPLRMHNTGYQDNSSGVANIYHDSNTMTGAQFGSPPVSEGSGHLYSTAEDLLLWDQALYTDQLVPQSELDKMLTAYVRETDLPFFGYGYGWFVGNILGRPAVGGAGGGPSFTTMYLRLPLDGFTLIVLQNQGGPDPEASLPSLMETIVNDLFLSDLIFVYTAFAFMPLLAILLAAQKNRWIKTTRVIGILWLLLIVPFTLVFYRYLAEGRGVWTLLPLSLVLLFMLVKALLDFVFRIDFRRNRITLLAYLTLNCLALFSLIWIAFSIDPSWGTLVLIAFGILAVSLIFMYRNKISVRQ